MKRTALDWLEIAAHLFLAATWLLVACLAAYLLWDALT